MPPIVTSVEIDRPAAEVFAYATDPCRFSEWQQGVTTRRVGGANRSSTSELVQYDSPKAWAVRGIDGPIRAESMSSSSRVTPVRG